MALTKDIVTNAMIDAIKDIQTQSGRDVPDIDYDTCPLVDVEGFTSQNLIEVICLLEEKLELDLPDGVFFDIHDNLTVNNLSQSVIDNISNK